MPLLILLMTLLMTPLHSAELDANDEARTTTSQSASIENNDYLNQMIDQTLLQTYQHLDLQHLQTNNQANTR